MSESQKVLRKFMQDGEYPEDWPRSACACCDDLADTIDQLTRELKQEFDAHQMTLGTNEDLREEIAKLTRERDEAHASLSEIHKLVGRGVHADPKQNASCAISGILSLKERIETELRSDTGELWEDECMRAREQRDEALRKVALFEPVVRKAAEIPVDDMVARRATLLRLHAAEALEEAEEKRDG